MENSCSLAMPSRFCIAASSCVTSACGASGLEKVGSKVFNSKVVGTGRFELPTCRLGGGRSIHLSYVPTISHTTILPALQALLPDVLAVMHPIEVDFLHLLISVVDRRRQRWAACGDAQHTAARCH